jgi:hypothetical protein
MRVRFVFPPFKSSIFCNYFIFFIESLFFSPKLPPLTLIRSKQSGNESDMTPTEPPSLRPVRFGVADSEPPPTKSRQHIIDPNGVPISQLRRIAAVQLRIVLATFRYATF